MHLCMTDVNVSPLRLNIHGGFVVVNLTWAVVEMVVEVVEDVVVEEAEEVEASDGGPQTRTHQVHQQWTACFMVRA